MDLSYWMSFIANAIAIFGIPYGAYQAYKGRIELKIISEERKNEERRKNEQISVVLVNSDQNCKIYLPNKIRRSVLARSEVMGRLGSIPKAGAQQERFDINYTTTGKFIEKIDSLYVSDKTELFVTCTSEEIKQFDIDKMKVLGFDVREGN